MGLRPGYKQTEIGVIPEDWEERAFRDLYLEPSRNGIYKTADFHGRGTRIVNMGEMFGFEFISDQEMSRVALTTKELSFSSLEDGDLLFGRRSVVPAGAGKCSLVVAPHEPLTFESSVIRVRLSSGDAHPLFYFYFFGSPTGRSVMSSIVTGTNIKGIRASELSRLKIPVPSKAEQEAIAEALSDADALIESLDQLIAKKRHLKQGAMQELLSGREHLPGFSGAWEDKPLRELGSWKGGMTPSMRNPTFWDRGTVSWISSGDVKSVLLTETASLITDEAVKQGKTTLLPPMSIVIVTRSGILRRYLPVAMNVVPMAINQDIKALIPAVNHVPLYLLQTLIGHGGRILASCMKSGTTVESIEFSWLMQFTVPMPGKEEQAAIAAVLSDMDAEIAALEVKLAKTRQIRQGMMHNLLTGKIRLL